MRREGDRCIATRLEFERKVAVEYELFGQPVFVTVEGGLGNAPAEATGGVSIVREEVPESSEDKVRVIKTEVAEKTVNLREEKTIVGVGAGVGSREGFHMAQELAEVLGGEIGATRAAVDAGWVSYDRQIGQTGVKVKPDLYVACGISGAAQHRVGMMDSGAVVSINIDTHSPMSRYSHYAVEGDVKVVIPKIIEILRG
jgi:electron transfer flavoprotein alpha subunit